MPLYKIISVSETTTVLVWKVSESYQELYDTVTLTEESEFRLQSMKSTSHQKAFLAVRRLLQTIGYTDFDVFYEQTGKPHLLDDHFISITHSFEFAAIIISETKCGIDMEKQRDKIIRIQDKFIHEQEETFIRKTTTDKVHTLTVVWAIKETLYKLNAISGLSFKQDMIVLPFEKVDKKAKAHVNVNGKLTGFDACFEEIESFVLVYAQL